MYPNGTNHCPLINDNEEYHYNSAGWKLLAGEVARELRALLAKGPKQLPAAAAMGLSRAAERSPRFAGAVEVCPVDAKCVARSGVEQCTTGCGGGSSCVPYARN